MVKEGLFVELSEIFKESNIIADVASKDKEGLFTELVDFLADRENIKNKEAVIDAVWERERMLNTIIAPAIALPHAGLRRQKETLGVFAVSHSGVDYGDSEGGLVHIIMLLIDDRSASKKHLRTLREAATLISSPNFFTKVMKCRNASEVYAVIREVEEMQRV
ncbi:MAG TPA: PTS sugar transporter subunit IIA [Spirochaetia bacterium]|nr:PTS sugar transporter subunit IIA [Spirochaetia bacterium]